MPGNDLWTQIPSSLLGLDKDSQSAEDWAQEQRAKIAELWAQTQKTVINNLQQEWQQKAASLAAPAMTQDDMLRYSPDSASDSLPAKTFPSTMEAPNSSDVMAPDLLSNPPTPPQGSAESAFSESMREGASHAGFYIEPPPGSITDPNKEISLKTQAEQSKSRPLIGPTGLGMYNPNMNPEGFKQQLDFGEEGKAVGQLANDVPGVGGLLKFAAGGGTDEFGKSADVAQEVSPELEKAKDAALKAQPAPLTKILGGVFYSKAEDIINTKLPAKATGQQILNTLINNGAKPAELAWTGLKEYLGGKVDQVLQKTDVQQFIRDNMVRVQEIRRGEDPTPPQQIVDKARLEELNNIIQNKLEEFQGAHWQGDRYVPPPQKVVDDYQSIIEPLLEERRKLEDTAYTPAEGSEPTKWGDVTLPGGKNYRELLLTLPPKEYTRVDVLPAGYTVQAVPARFNSEGTRMAAPTYRIIRPDGSLGSSSTDRAEAIAGEIASINSNKADSFISSHWDEPNVLAHVRFDDRVDPQGKPTLFLQEVQSDWAQKGRQQGFGKTATLPEDYTVTKNRYGEWEVGKSGELIAANEDKQAAIRDAIQSINEKSVPAMPFQRTEDWVKLAAKRMIAYAAENNYDRIAWTTGKQQDKIEGLGSRFNSLSYDPVKETLSGTEKDDSYVHLGFNVPKKTLISYVGQDIADRLLATPLNAEGHHVLLGDDLNQTTKGMAEFYDKILPSVFRDLGKQYGARVEDIPVQTVTDNTLGELVGGRPRFVIADEGSRRFGTYHGTVSIFDRKTGQNAATGIPEIRANEELQRLTAEGSKEIVHSIVLPAAMKQVAKNGQTLFSSAAVGGGIAGAAYGSTQGTTDQEREQNALNYGLGGALAGHALAGGDLPFGMSIKPVYNDPVLQRTADMLHAKPPEANYLSSQSFLNRLGSNAARAWTDSGIDLVKLQQNFAKAVGRSLTAGEQLAELRRLSADPAALLNLKKNFAPALQQVGEKDQDALSQYLMYRHNIEVANAMGDKEQQQVLGQELTNLPAKDQLQTLQARLRMYSRFLNEGIANQDGTVIMHYQPLVQNTQKLVQNARARLATQTTTAQLARANRALQAGQQIAQDRKFSFGFRLDTSIDSLQRLENEIGPQRFANVQDAARQVVAFNKSLLQKKVDAGILTQDFADELNRLYPEYVPIRIIDYMTDRAAQAGSGRKALSMSDDTIRKLSEGGTEKSQEDPLAATVRLAYQTEGVANRNKVFNALHNMLQAAPGFEPAITEVDEHAKDTRTLKIVKGFVNGELKYYAMPADLAAAIEAQPNRLMPGLAQVMALQRALLATANPLFIGTHAMITTLPYLMRTTTREGGPQALPRVAGALASAYWDSLILPTLSRTAFKGRYGPDTERYIAGGGGMGSAIFDRSPSAAKATLEDLSRANVFHIRNAGDVRRLTLAAITGKPFENIINRVDLAPRVAAMKLAERRGANAVQAVNEGRTATIDFAQGGDWAKVVNQFIPFFNVAVQGSMATSRAYRDNPKAFIATAIALLAAPVVGAEAWNRSDPQRAKDYDDVPNFYKDTGVVVMAPTSAIIDAHGNRKPNFVYLPLREFGPFAIITREIAGRAMGASPRNWTSLLYGEDLLAPNGGLLTGLTPAADVGRLVPGGPAGNIAIASRTGVNPSTGGNIRSKAADADAGIAARGIASAANAVKTSLGGMPDVPPSDIQYGLSEAGGPGRIIAQQGRPQGVGSSLNPAYKNATGQDLQNAKQEHLSSDLRRLLLDAKLPDVTPAARAISGIPLTQQEETELQNNLNAAFEQVAQQIMTDPRYQQASQEIKTSYAKDKLSAVRALVAQKYLATMVQRNGSDAMRQRLKQATQKAS